MCSIKVITGTSSFSEITLSVYKDLGFETDRYSENGLWDLLDTATDADSGKDDNHVSFQVTLLTCCNITHSA